MRFLFSSKMPDLNLAKDFPGLQLLEKESGYLLINDTECITENDDFLSVTNGYLRNFNLQNIQEQKVSAAQHIINKWPVEDHITGSFSSLLFDKRNKQIITCTDLANIYPIYHLRKGEDFFISNSIILLGRYSEAEFDLTGIFQRAIGPDFAYKGSRTILKNCKSLLPGEWIKFNSAGEKLEVRFDNSLYQNMSSPHLKEGMVQEYWNHYKKEVELCTENFSEVNIALSGGIDSRVALGAISENKEIRAHTFGEASNYETKIAAKLAKIKHAKHISYFKPGLYFPPQDVLNEYTRNTESVKLNSWLEILEEVETHGKQPLILGELCEGLPARNIKKFSSAKFRKDNFFKYYIQNKDFEFTPANPSNFEKWKTDKRAAVLSWQVDFWFEKSELKEYKKQIIRESTADLDEIFSRIQEHNLPYSELYDELFSWYTFTRMELSRQVNICNEKFYAFSPGMSMQMLKKTSNLHPNLRLYYRFANKLLYEAPELREFRKVPTSQIPLIPQNFPNILKIPIWGIRSRIDDFLVKKMMKKKDIRKRYRLFKSINWAMVYQQPDMLENIKSYYKENNLGEGYFETYLNAAEKRKELVKWPFANMDLMSGATLNSEMNLIKHIPD